jgi:hypothetical protein
MAVPNVPTAPKKMLTGSPEDITEANRQLEEQEPRYSDQLKRQDLLLRRLQDRENKRNLQLSRPGSNLGKQARLQSRFEEAKQSPITNTYMAGMISLALFFDLLTGIINFTGVGSVVTDIFISPIAIAAFYYFYRKKGIDFGDSKVLVRFWGSVLLKFIPVLNIIPEYTLNVFLVTSVEKIERKTGISLPKK